MKKLVRWDPGTLDKARDRSGLTNREVSGELVISSATWARWKQSDQAPADRAEDLERLLGIHPSARVTR